MHFEDLNVDPIDGAETMGIMELNEMDLIDPVSFSKVKDIIDFFKGASDKRYMLNKIMDGKIGPGRDKVNHVWQYTQLRKEHAKIKDTTTRLEKEISIFER